MPILGHLFLFRYGYGCVYGYGDVGPFVSGSTATPPPAHSVLSPETRVVPGSMNATGIMESNAYLRNSWTPKYHDVDGHRGIH